MKGYLMQEQSFVAGNETFIESSSPENNYAVVFEDDTETGYFYALSISKLDGTQLVLDALHVYEAEEIADDRKAGVAAVVWSSSWMICALLINNYCYAVFDFANRGGYCRSAFRPPIISGQRETEP